MIEIRHLRKEYDQTVALENLHLDIPEGEVYGLIGPNGAGKTTLIRVLATLLEPTYGRVRIATIATYGETLHTFVDRSAYDGSSLLHDAATLRRPLLLIHGWPQSWYAWRHVMPRRISSRHGADGCG